MQNGARDWVVNQAQTISSAGFTGNAFNTHPPHTVRGKETKQCDDCHVSRAGDNNAWMASVLMLGSNQVNFMGRYIYVAQGGGGLSAVAVTEREEPQAVFGSHLHGIAYPANYAAFKKGGQELNEAVHHGGDVKQVQLFGEYLLAAGSDGFQVFDVANVGNKSFAQPIVTSPFRNQQMSVSTKNATGLAVGSPAPLDLKRVQLPINEEQPIAKLYRLRVHQRRRRRPRGRGRRDAVRRDSDQQSPVAERDVQPGRAAHRRLVHHRRRQRRVHHDAAQRGRRGYLGSDSSASRG